MLRDFEDYIQIWFIIWSVMQVMLCCLLEKITSSYFLIVGVFKIRRFQAFCTYKYHFLHFTLINCSHYKVFAESTCGEHWVMGQDNVMCSTDWKSKPVAGRASELAWEHAENKWGYSEHCATFVPMPAAFASWEKEETKATGVCKRILLKVQENHLYHSTTYFILSCWRVVQKTGSEGLQRHAEHPQVRN